MEQHASALSWEILVIDNASDDATSSACAHILGGCRLTYRIVREEWLGQMKARRRAAREARGDVVCFLDDDNVPARGFVACAVGFFAEHAQAAVVGSRVVAEWESSPTPLALRVCEFALAIRDQGGSPVRLDDAASGVVGAGLCARREWLVRALDERSALAFTLPAGRKGDRLTGGDDTALCILARRAGYECWYSPDLVVRHRIPARRMEIGYLVRLYEGIGRSQAAVRRLYDWRARVPVLRRLIGVKDLGRWLLAHRRAPTVPRGTDPALARDLHTLEMSQLRGRALGALGF
jgi:glycosyltransferase involved in cell wall biosynthesis